ncbi:histidine--tRNA ligase [[Mycoplasma] collis]|uniref:histidine--tRNA ligase n=1 Tax=[Mycoplasma] collis TaxID=2127 RepID=UPI00051C6C59|nr:histidine--tRNA ligase [[Mycoplasma] collis]
MYFKVKGTRDFFKADAILFEKIKNIFFKKANIYNSSLIETPIFEYYNLFSRTSGEQSDIVNKEMYSFKDKGDRLIALRPEGTAPVARAIIENKLYLTNQKFHYFGPQFRYERPQKGRFRQFYQAGIEFLSPKNIYLDFEVLHFAVNFLKDLKIDGYTLKINYLGSKEEKLLYINILKKYFTNFKDQLSDISLERIEKNPLRILDDKVEQDKEFVKNAPKIIEVLSDESKDYFNKLTNLLKENNIKFEIDYSLVRGLDYYNDLVFEFVSQSKALGTKTTLIGGGRYNHLFQELGGPEISAIGFAIGIDRILEIIKYNSNILINEYIDYYVGIINENEYELLLKVINKLRDLNYKVEFNKKNLSPKKIFEQAKKNNAKNIIFIEKNQNSFEFTVKNLINGKKEVFTLEKIN